VHLGFALQREGLVSVGFLRPHVDFTFRRIKTARTSARLSRRAASLED
jgi:hypothetical protein